jgi:hypothetical protein
MINIPADLEAMVEIVARQVAAERMGLRRDTEGAQLPDDLWQQCIPQAREFLGLK